MTPHRLHLLGVPHTRTHLDFSHCAFTQKVLKFIPMMRAQGCEVWHYGVGTENPGADRHFEVMTSEEQIALLGHDHSASARGSAFYGDDANVGNACYDVFNRALKPMLDATVRREDFVCLPFGHAHQAAMGSHKGINVETGIGYPTTFEQFRIFESYAWLHRLGGTANPTREGTDYEWVIPNYFVADDWPLYTGERQYLAYFGRIGTIKGLDIVQEIAKHRPDLDVVICGQGDASPWLSPSIPNLRAIPPLAGRARAKFLGQAIALLAPSRYIEPFCGVTVEANLCGTPALTSHFGAFTETIQNGFNGQRCRTLGDWLAAVEWAEKVAAHSRADERLDKVPVNPATAIREHAVTTYSLEAIGPQYRDVFDTLADVRSGKGYYTQRSSIGAITKAITLSPAVALPSAAPVANAVAASFPSSPTPVSAARWDAAQVYERAYWLGGDAERIAFVNKREREQHVFYRGLMRISPENCNDKRVLDIGCGPFSIGLDVDLDLAHLVAVDPAVYAESDEHVYRSRARVQRLYVPVEALSLSPETEESIDEIWCYNLLQHVLDPAACLRIATRWSIAHGAILRIFEWCNVPPNEGHPHVLTAAWLREELRANGFTMRKEMSGMETVEGYQPTEFYAAIWERP